MNLSTSGSFSTQKGSDGALINYTIITSLGSAGSTTSSDLQGMNGNVAGNYALGGNIDAAATSGWNGGAGFVPVGIDASRFAGNFDGLGHTVSNLVINRTGINHTGLFGYTASGSIVRNVGMLGGTVTSDSWSTGSLVGSLGGSLLNSYATTNVTAYQTAGGLVGVIDGGLIADSHAGGAVVSNGNGEVGGLVGLSWGCGGGTVNNSYATGNVSSTVGNVGGLMGINWGTVTNSYATGTATGTDYIGGLIGNNSLGTISNSYARGAVSGQNYVGGLAGNNSNTIGTSYATGSVNGSDSVGGLIGANNGTVTMSYSMGAVTGTTNVGGLIGSNSFGSISNSYWNTTTSGQATSAAGTGMTTTALQTALPSGFSSGTWGNASNRTTPYLLTNAGPALIDTDTTATFYNIVLTLRQLQNINANTTINYALANDIDASATSTWNSGQGFLPIGLSGDFTGKFDGLGHTVNNLFINRSGTNNVGLFGVANSATFRNVGVANGTITGNTYVGLLVANCFACTYSTVYSTGSVTGVSWVGGLVGLGNGTTMTNSYSKANVTGSGQLVGGLFGQARFFGTIDNSFATGTVSGGSATYVGGLTGQARYITLTNTYATGNVTGGYGVGGLTGILDGATINTSYSTGAVSGSGGGVGGLVGTLAQTTAVNNSYWNTTTSGQASSQGGTGLTTSAMEAALPTGFSSGAWGNAGNHSTPYLLSNLGPVLIDGDATTTYYNPIVTLQQLQNINTNLSGNFALANDINATSFAFTPIGTSGTPFIGKFNGLAHTISNLSISQNADNAGLFGVNGAAGVITNVRMNGANIYYYVRSNGGSLVGFNYGTVTNSYASNFNVNGGRNAGGLVGRNQGTIRYSAAATGNTGATFYSGGLVGYMDGSGLISNSYSSGTSSGSNIETGGFIGGMDAPSVIENSYTTGTAYGSHNGYIGAFIGYFGGGTITNSFFATTYTSQGSGLLSPASGGFTGLSTSAIKNQASYTPSGSGAGEWDFTNVWTIYEGQTAPLLRSFMTPLTVTANNATKTYDGSAYAGSAGVTYSTSPNMSNVLGTLAYASGINAGSHAITASGLYSNQLGYLITFAPGTLTVNPYSVTITGSRTYNGTTTVNAGMLSLNTLPNGETLSLSGSGSVAGKDVGNGKAVTLGSLALGNGTGLASNYTLTGGSINITPVTLTATASASNKVYDGTTTASATFGSLSGLVGSETLNTTLSATFNTKDVATANLVTVNSVLLSNGTNGGLASNYTMASGQTASASITPKALSANAVATDKVYDGNTSANATLTSITGTIGSETVGVTASGTFNSKDVASANLVTVNTVGLANGTNGGLASNYSLSGGQTATAHITPKALTATANATGKIYDGTTSANASLGSIVGLIGGETVGTTSTAAFNTKDVATANLVTINSIVLSNGSNGGLASNYSMASGQTASASITPKALTATASATSKVYDGTTTANATLGAITGLIGSETVGATTMATFNSKNVATANVVTVNSVALSDGMNGGLAGNYTLAAGQTASASITPRALTLSGQTAFDKIYDGTTAATLSPGTLVGAVSGDSLSIAPAGSFAAATVGHLIPVTASNTLSGADASNYTLIQPTGLSADIRAAATAASLPQGVSSVAAFENARGVLTSNASESDNLTNTLATGFIADSTSKQTTFVAPQSNTMRFDGLNLLVIGLKLPEWNADDSDRKRR